MFFFLLWTLIGLSVSLLQPLWQGFGLLSCSTSQCDGAATWKRRSASTCQPPTSGLPLTCLFTLKETHFKRECCLPSHIKQLSWITAHFCVCTFTVHLSPASNMGFRTAVCEHKDYIWWSVLTWGFFFFGCFFSPGFQQFICDTCGSQSLTLVPTDEWRSHPGRAQRREQDVHPRRKVTLI